MRYHITANIQKVLQDPTTNWFTRGILEQALTMDEADALIDTERVAELLRERANIFLGETIKEEEKVNGDDYNMRLWREGN